MSAITGLIGWSPEATVYLKTWIISIIISAMAYGCVVSLTLSYIPPLLGTSNDNSRRMRIFLLLYVTFMLSLSTIFMVTVVVTLITNIFDPLDGNSKIPFSNGIVGQFCVVLASWGADGFMLWRCAMLYKGISRPRWLALVALLCVMALMSLAVGLCLLSNQFINDLIFKKLLIMIGITICLNLITAALITLRILHYSRFIRKVMGMASSRPYTMIVLICLESAALIVVINLVFCITVVTSRGYSNLVPMQLLVHVYVLSPLLIVYRVAQGKAVTIRSSECRPVVSRLRFESGLSQTSSNKV